MLFCDMCDQPIQGLEGTDYSMFDDGESGLHQECYQVLVDRALSDEPTIPLEEVIKQLELKEPE